MFIPMSSSISVLAQHYTLLIYHIFTILKYIYDIILNVKNLAMNNSACFRFCYIRLFLFFFSLYV